MTQFTVVASHGFPSGHGCHQCYCVCANAISGLPDYLLLPAPLLPVLLLPLLDLPDDFEEKSLVMNSETSGSSWLEFSIFIDCSISCRKAKHIDMKVTGILQVIQQLTLPLRKRRRETKKVPVLSNDVMSHPTAFRNHVSCSPCITQHSDLSKCSKVLPGV